jgi:signal peptidase complex subunit 2
MQIKEMGYDVNYRSDNMKLMLMLLACVAAMIAQFFPIPFPENRMVLGICCGSYFAMSCVLQYIVTFVDKDTIALTNSLKVSISIIL